MASIRLAECWLHDITDLSDFVLLAHSDLQIDQSRNVESRFYAGGRVRSISTPNRSRLVQFTAHSVSRSVLDKLDGWLGSTLMLRTPSGINGDEGYVLSGFVADLPATLIWDGLHTVPITFLATTDNLGLTNAG